MPLTSGLWCSVNRLRDFRLTTQIARRRENGDTELQDLPDNQDVGQVYFVSVFGRRSPSLALVLAAVLLQFSFRCGQSGQAIVG